MIGTFGLILCFLFPGILIGLLLGEAHRQARARALREKRARAQEKRLYVYDLHADWEELKRAA